MAFFFIQDLIRFGALLEHQEHLILRGILTRIKPKRSKQTKVALYLSHQLEILLFFAGFEDDFVVEKTRKFPRPYLQAS